MSVSANTIAWCGWQLPALPDWRPLRILGDWADGEMMIGNADEALFRVKWSRPKTRHFDAAARLAKITQRLAAAEQSLAHAAGLEPVAYFPDVPAKDHTARGLWYGYAPAAALFVEITINRSVAGPALRFIEREMLPHLTVTGKEEATRWALYSVSFTTPAGFALREWKLFPGDIALLLTNAGKERLVVRQVYPATTALARRHIERWLTHSPFREHRRYRPTATTGLVQHGRKRFPIPFHWIAPRRSVAGAVRDEALDRLLLAQLDVTGNDGEERLAAVFRGMNA